MAGKPKPLVVDGPRPAVQWVSSLPRDWTTTRERLVLFLLAADTFDQGQPFDCSPTQAQVAEWAGEFKGRISEALEALTHPTATRPALLATTPGTGRGRNTYRLLVPASWSGTADHEPRRLWSVTPDHNDSRSGPASGPGRGPGERTTPSPLPPVVPSPSRLTVVGGVLTIDDLTKIADVTGGDIEHAEKVANDVLGRATRTPDQPLRYVVAAVGREPDRYRPTKRNVSSPDEECPIHAGGFRHHCTGCAADAKAAN